MPAKPINDSNFKEKRIGKVSSKRQLTIPKEFYDRLNIVKDVEMVMEADALIIKPLTPPDGSPRRGWEEAFKRMHQQKDDNLLMDDTLDNDLLEDWDED